MPTIGVAVSDEIRQSFASIARQRGITTSRLAASIIQDLIRLEAEGSQPQQSAIPNECAAPPDRTATKTEQVFVRLNPYYFGELNRLASERNWYRGTYLANLFLAHADRRPVLCEAEINTVRQATRQLADVGRNLNQIAKRFNASPDHRLLPMPIDFEVVRMLVELEVTAMKELIRANLRGWGIDHVET